MKVTVKWAIDNWLVLHVEAAHPLLVVTGEGLESYFCKTYGTLHRSFYFLLAYHKDDKITFQLDWWCFHPRWIISSPNALIAKMYSLLLVTVFSHFPLPIPFIALTESHPDNACDDSRIFKRSSFKSLFPVSRICKLEPLPICQSNQQFSNWLKYYAKIETSLSTMKIPTSLHPRSWANLVASKIFVSVSSCFELKSGSWLH